MEQAKANVKMTEFENVKIEPPKANSVLLEGGLKVGFLGIFDLMYCYRFLTLNHCYTLTLKL